MLTKNMNKSTNFKNNNFQQQQEAASSATKALLRSLDFQGVQFLRFMTIDACNNIRCKVRPVPYLLKQQNSSPDTSILDTSVSVATVCYAGLPYYADYMIPGTGMNARHVQSLKPDMNTFRVLPYASKSATMICNFSDQYTNEPSELCTRTLLQTVVDKAASLNIGFNVGVELEFCLVDAKTGTFVDDSVFANTDTLNQQEEFISDVYTSLEQQYITVELLHSESGPGQLELVLEYSSNPIEMADHVLLAKETIKAIAHKYGLKALFIPKYDLMKAGNGMHIHISTRPLDAKAGDDRTFCDGSELTSTGGAFVEGMLQHLPGLLGLTLPTVNSFRRVGPGCWTGSVVGWNVEDKECGIRVCSNLASKSWDHVEYKLCDSTSNLYLALAGILTAGLDGIEKSMQLREPLGDNPPTDSETAPVGLPDSVTEALDATEKDDLIYNQLLGGNGDEGNLGKAYVALRRHEAERARDMSLEDEVKEFLARA